MYNAKYILERFQIENEKRQFAKLLAGLYIHLRKKERRVCLHILHRNMAEDGFCYEFYKNIAKHTGVSRNTISKYVNLFIQNKLIERTVKWAKYRYRRGLLATKLGLCFYIFVKELNIYFKNNNYNKEIKFFDFLYKYILNIFHLFYNILGSMHNQKHKENPKEDNKEQKIGDFGIKELPKGKIFDKPPPNDYQRVWNLKKNQYIKCLKAGINLPEEIIKEYKLEEFLK